MTKKKKILILANHFITLYNFRKELIIKLVKDNDVYLSIPKSSENKYFTDLGCKIIETNVNRKSKNPFADFKLITEYFKVIRKVKPDVIFSYTIKPNIYGTIASNILNVKHVSNITGTGETFLKNNSTSKIVKLLYKVSIKYSNKVFFQNNGDLDFFKENKLIKNNYKLIPGSGVNLNEYAIITLPEENPIQFIFIGRIMKIKGIEEYIVVAKNLKKKYGEKVKFLVAGFIEEGKYEEIINENHKNNIIEYLGFQKDIKKWVEKSHCTVLPSHGGEGVPNVLLESSAIGRACIASDISGSNNVVENGENGFLFEAKDAKDLENKIESFIKLDYEKKIEMGLYGRKKVEKEFDRELIINEYLSEIKS